MVSRYPDDRCASVDIDRCRTCNFISGCLACGFQEAFSGSSYESLGPNPIASTRAASRYLPIFLLASVKLQPGMGQKALVGSFTRRPQHRPRERRKNDKGSVAFKYGGLPVDAL